MAHRDGQIMASVPIPNNSNHRHFQSAEEFVLALSTPVADVSRSEADGFGDEVDENAEDIDASSDSDMEMVISVAPPKTVSSIFRASTF